MVKRNNAIVKNHFKKTAISIKTWFNQPARATKRREVRIKKQKEVTPNPINKLRPIVRCPTIRYNKKLRLGRGFTPEECKEAGLDYLYARSIGIAVDLKRRNTNKESFSENVKRLLEYKGKIKIYANRKEAKEAGAKEYKGIIMPLVKKEIKVETVSASEMANL